MSAPSTTELKHFFFDNNLTAAISAGVKETLHEMCRLSCDFENSFVAKTWSPLGEATGHIELVSEKQRGVLLLHFSEPATLTIMAKLLGRSPLRVNDDVLDCVGALTGIIYGRMKAILNPQGYKFVINSPAMNYTQRHSNPEGAISHLIVPFRVANSKCFIQVVLYA